MSASASRAWMMSGRPVCRAASIWTRRLSCWAAALSARVVVVEPGLADADELRVPRRGRPARRPSPSAPRRRASGGCRRRRTRPGAPRRWRGPWAPRGAGCRSSRSAAPRPRRARATSAPDLALELGEVEVAVAVGDRRRCGRGGSALPQGPRAPGSGRRPDGPGGRLVGFEDHIEDERCGVKVDRPGVARPSRKLDLKLGPGARGARTSGASRAASAASPGAASALRHRPRRAAPAARAPRRTCRASRRAAPRWHGPPLRSASAIAAGRSSRGMVARRPVTAR